MLSTETLAEDAAQEIFIKSYQALDQFHAKSSFATWLYRIAANHCTDVLRKIARSKTESWEALLEKEGEKVEALLTASSGDEQSVEDSDLITKLLSHLPENYREILILREMHGLSYQELAETLKCSIDAVKARLKRARQDVEQKARHILKINSV